MTDVEYTVLSQQPPDSNNNDGPPLPPFSAAVPPRDWAWPVLDEDGDGVAVSSPYGWQICNGTEDADDCVRPLRLPVASLDFPVFGVISPAIIVFTVVTNSLVCVVLLRPNMRSATNVLLVAMALSDMMTGVWPLPCYVYFYMLGRAADYVPYDWCFAFHCLNEYLPIVCHTASIWLTVGLAVHRYICVCHSLVAKKLCTVANVVRAIVAVYAVAFASQLTRFVELRYAPVRLASLLNDPSIYDSTTTTPPDYSAENDDSEISYAAAEAAAGMSVPDTATLQSSSSYSPSSSATLVVVGCVETYATFVADHMNVYHNVYYWFRVVFIHLIPCSVLIVLNALLVHTMRTAQRRRRQLLAQNRKSECRRLAESNMTTMMLVAVVGVFLLAEVPLACMMIVIIVDSTWDLQLIDEYVAWIAPLLLNLFILLSYPLNFFIYCAMSRQFRDTFRGLCCCCGLLGGSGGSGPSGDASRAGGGYGSGNRNNIGAEQTTVYATVAGIAAEFTTNGNGNRDDDRKTSSV